MDARVDVPEITTACWDILGKSPADVMCASSRMVVKRRGAAAPAVVACTLTPYDPQFELGATLAEALGAETACLGRFIPSAQGTPERLVTLALVINGELVPNAEYMLAGTPSERLATQAQFCVTQGLLAQFPQSVVVGKTAAEAYAGQQLCDSAGTLIGMLPGTLVATVFGAELEAALSGAGSINWWLVGGMLALLGGGGAGSRGRKG